MLDRVNIPPQHSKTRAPRSTQVAQEHGLDFASADRMTRHSRWLIPCCLIVLSAGCELAEESTGTRSHAAVSGMPLPDAKTLFRGLVLGHGPVAQLVPEIRDHLGLDAAPLTPEQKAQALTLVDEIIAAVESHHREFLVWFEAEIASGDHYRVAAALDRGRQVVLEMLPHTSVGPVSDEVAEALDEEVTAVLALAIHVAVALNVWAAVHNMVALSAIGWRYVISYSEVGEGPHVNRDLLEEEMVDSIVMHVSPHLRHEEG